MNLMHYLKILKATYDHVLWNSHPDVFDKNRNQEKENTCNCGIGKRILFLRYGFYDNLIFFDRVDLVVKAGDFFKILCMKILSRLLTQRPPLIPRYAGRQLPGSTPVTSDAFTATTYAFIPILFNKRSGLSGEIPMLYIPSVKEDDEFVFEHLSFLHFFDKRNGIIIKILFINAVSQFFNGKFLSHFLFKQCSNGRKKGLLL